MKITQNLYVIYASTSNLVTLCIQFCPNQALKVDYLFGIFKFELIKKWNSKKYVDIAYPLY